MSKDPAHSVHIQANGAISGIINTGTISGDVSQVISQIPADLPDGLGGLRDMLIELQRGIEEDSALTDVDRNDALEQVKTLAEVGLEKGSTNVDHDRIAKAGRNALKILKGTVAGLGESTKLVTECSRLLPAIATLLALL